MDGWIVVVTGVPEQGWELQSLVWMCGPWHLLPPCSGEGDLQNRSLIWTPESHLAEHVDHWDHAVQPPFTESKCGISVFFLFHPSWGVKVYDCITWTLNGVARFLLLTVSNTGGGSIVKSCKCAIAAAETASKSNIVHMVETCLTAFWPAGPFSPQSICQTCTRDRQYI